MSNLFFLFQFILFLNLTLVNAGIYKPEQIRISWTENKGEMRVTWVSYISVDSFVVYRPVLCLGEDTTWKTIQGTSQTFNEGEIVVKFQYIYTAVMNNLNSECSYEYYIRNSITESEIYMFSGRTPETSPPYLETKRPLSMIVFGDLGIGTNAMAVKDILLQEAKLRNFLGIIHMGDIAYNLDQDDGTTGDGFLNIIQPLAANYAYMAIIGNHEGYNNSTHFRTRFKMPVNQDNQGSGYFYSFNIGPVHWIVISTEVYIDNTKKASAEIQTNWLKKDLEAANKNRENFPWIFVLTHHPLYCSTHSAVTCGSEAELYQSILEDILYENSIDIMLQAHVHSYERDKPIYKNLTVKSDYDDKHTHINAKAPLYILSGNAGNREGHNEPLPPTYKDWGVYMADDFGFGKLFVYNETHVLWTQYSATLMKVDDYVWLIKDQPRYN
ncbi:unnamed protein product [Blepharisma stoltei]|uniref:Purple acid phosphatase n=1 Tax=Blepharisma stoltei TaxID=1481888 RepID=A0AAU9K7A5_9CILI|nr:unnamed protein product [Blepharisma stoltei]